MDDFARLIHEMTKVDLPAPLSEFVAIREGTNYLAGTTIQALGIPIRKTESGLFVVGEAEIKRSEIPHLGVYLTIGDYIDLETFGITSPDKNQGLIVEMISKVPRDYLLRALAEISAMWSDRSKQDHLIDLFSAGLQANQATRLRMQLTAGNPPRVFLTRQLILQAYSEILQHGSESNEIQGSPHMFAIMICHGCATLNSPQVIEEDYDVDLGISAQLALNLISNLRFNSTDDPLTLLARTIELWSADIVEVNTRLGDRTPSMLVEEATGLTFGQWIAAGLAIYSRVFPLGEFNSLPKWKPSDDDLGKIVAMQIQILTGTGDELDAALTAPRSEWDFLRFQQCPCIRLTSGQVIVTDPVLFLEKLTIGLYWMVFDSERRKLNKIPQNWTSGWGVIVENYVLQRLRFLVAELKTSNSVLYTESDMKAAYPGEGIRRADAVFVDDNSVLLFEVISSGLRIGSWQMQQTESFKDDLEKVIYEKIEQLHDAALCIRVEPKALIGDTKSRNMVSIVVSGAGLANSLVLDKIIDSYCSRMGIFMDQSMSRPIVIDLGEVEMLEALSQQDVNPVHILNEWRNSKFCNVSLRNFLIEKFKQEHIVLRPRSLETGFRNVINAIVSDLKNDQDSE